MFLSVDPLAADYASWSPYNYVMGNPISYIDPDGRSPEDTGGDPIKQEQKAYHEVTTQFFGAIAPVTDKVGAFFNAVSDKIDSAISTVSSYFEEGNHVESGRDLGDVGEGITVLSNSGKNSTGSIGTSNGETSTAIIETNELFTPGAGHDRSFAKNIIGQPVSGIKNAVDAADNIINAVDRLSGDSQVPKNDTIYTCASCTGTYKDSSGVKVKVAPNKNKPQKIINTHY